MPTPDRPVVPTVPRWAVRLAATLLLAAPAAVPLALPSGLPLAPALVPAAAAVGTTPVAGSADTSGDPSDAVTWGVRTADNDHGTQRENFRYTLDPGATLKDELVVTNHGEQPLALDVYAADGYTTTAGRLDALTRDTASSAVGTWLEPGVGRLRLAPGESETVPFTIRVPDDATPGDHAGAVLTSRTVTAQDSGLDYEARSGIRVHLRVAGDLAPRLTVTGAHVEYHHPPNPFGLGDATVTYTVRNEGNVRLAARQQVSVAGPFGWLRADGAADDVPELLPGESWPVSVRVDGVVPLVRLGADAVLTAELPAVDGATPGIAPVEAHASGWAVPWALLAAVVASVLAVVVLVRRRRSRAEREAARVQAAVERALAERDAAQGTGPEHEHPGHEAAAVPGRVAP